MDVASLEMDYGVSYSSHWINNNSQSCSNFISENTITRSFGDINYINGGWVYVGDPNVGPCSASGTWMMSLGREWRDAATPTPTPSPNNLATCNDFALGCTDAVCVEIPEPVLLDCQTLWPEINIPLQWMNGPITLIWSGFAGISDLHVPGVELCLETISPNISLFGWDAVAILSIFGGLLLIAMISKEIRS